MLLRAQTFTSEATRGGGDSDESKYTERGMEQLLKITYIWENPYSCKDRKTLLQIQIVLIDCKSTLIPKTCY